MNNQQNPFFTPLSIRPVFGQFLIFFLLLPQFLTAQFHLNGSATRLSERCFQLTGETNSVVGSIWDTTKISLTQSFDVNLDLFFGCKDANGADGIVFGFQPVSTSIGSVGEGMGFLGVNPSLGIEMDTWQNTNQNDPPADHIAIIKNGVVNHGTTNNLAGPISLGNIEDCRSHNIRVQWLADSQKLVVSFDCQPVLTYKADIVNEIFGGNPNVFWGFTAATGGANNRHEVCFKYTTFLDKPTKVELCRGDTLQLKASGGITYKWSPAVGLDNPNIANPIARPDTTTTYRVVVKDNCGYEYINEIELKVSGDPLSIELGNDTLLCDGQTIRLNATTPRVRSYLWNDGLRDSIRTIDKAGLYKIKVARGFCIGEDSIKIRYLSPPSLKLPTDTLICDDKPLIINAQFEASEYRWQDGSNKYDYVVRTAGKYSVAVKNKCGDTTANIAVTTEDCNRIFFPNVFSPNDDGVNDFFYPRDGGNVEVIQVFHIYDRWGGMVYNRQNIPPNDLTNGWDGRLKNGEKAKGTYVYWAEIKLKSGEIIVRKGDVNVVL
jgi:gliding motility-associated-like protein